MPNIESIKNLQRTAVLFILGSIFVTHTLGANLISNGTFETPNIGGVGSISYAAGSTAITGWTVDTTPADGVQIIQAGVIAPNDGTQILQLTGGPGDVYSVGGGVHQTITTTSNQLYSISIAVASRQNNSVTGNFSFGGQNHTLPASSTTFTNLTWTVTATNTSPVIDITGNNPSSGQTQLIIDNVSVTAPAGPVNAGISTVTAAPNSIPADGSTTATITVSLQDASGNPVSGKTVTLTSSRGTADTISAASGTSSASGIVTFTVQSTTPGMAVFSATDVTDSLPLTSTTAVFVYDVGAIGPQASPDPIVFDQTATNDNLVVLMAAASEYSSDLTLYQDGPSAYPKHFWINNWSNGTNDYFKWNVALATGAVYHVYAKLSAGAAVPLQLSITGTNTVLNFTTRNIGWDKLDCGTISIPAGTNQLVLRKNTTDTSQVLSIKSLELIRQSDLPAYQQRVASFRANTTWLSQAKYGLMTQFGAWGYPPTGPQPSLQNMANGFSVSNFVNLVTNTGSKYVIFSLTWWSYQMLAPIQAVTNIVPGNANLTSTRDVIGELSAALHAVGVRFMLYYHCGSDSQSPGGYDSTPWWQAQQFPEPSYTERGVGDRSIFLTNWCNVISEIGNRYGTNLDGWFIDDGLVYYPAPFEHLGQAARAGNPNRLICYNPWIATEYTDFQDVFMGEESQGQSQFGSTPNGGNGVFTDGPQVGLLQHGMFPMEQDWGIHQANQPITTQINASQAIGWVQSASARGVPLSFNMMLWSDMTYSTNSLNVLLNLKSAIYGGSSASLSSNNLVVNGTFESPVTSSATLLAAGSTALTGWTVDNTPSDGIQLGAAGTFGPNNGSQNLQLTGGSTYAAGGGISQTIATTPGATYTIIIDVASRQGNAVTGNFNFGGSNYVLNTSSAFFTTLSWKVVATGSNTLINITGNTNSASGQLLIDNVSVTLFADPNIQTQPVSQLATIGSTASFSVNAGGTAPFSYQWQANGGTGFTNLINGGQLSGVNTNVLTISGATTNWALTYQVILTNSVGSITSSPATLTLVPYSLFVTNSISISNYSFENPTIGDGNFTTTLPGWSTSGSAAAFAIINPGTNNWPSATPPGMDGVNAGQIFMTAPGQSGILYQDTGIKYVAGVTYQLTAAIGLQSNQVFDTNSAVVFYNSALTAIASNVITPAKLVAGAFTNLTLTYTATGNEGGNGDIVVGFYAPPAAAGSSYFDFDNVQLSATYPTYPVITSQPTSQSDVIGSPISFNVTASGTAPLSYQWQATNSASGGYTNLVNGGQISGVTSNVLAITGVTTNQALSYRVIVTNSYGSVTSTVAVLTVLPFVAPPNVFSPGAMGPALAANVVGSYSSPPANLVTISVTGGLVTGNGDMAITVGGASSALQFYVGKADFFGVLRGGIMPVGSLTLSAPALSGSSYALNQNVGPATVTGSFVNGSSGLTVTSWVASGENTAVIQLNNTGTAPLALSSQLLDGFASSAGNPGTYGATNNSTWLNVSPDTVYVELGNQLHNLAGTAPFTGKIADLRLYNQALSGATLANLDGVGVPTPLLRWSTTNQGTASLVGNASLNPGDPHGGSVSVASGSDEVAVGDLPLPERQFTVSAWVNVASTSVNGNIVTAQIPYQQIYGSSLPFPFVRGLTLKLVNGALSATLNQSGTYNGGNDEFGADSPNHFTTTAASTLPANQWIEASVTYDGNTLTIFTNGVQVGTPVTFPTGTSGMLGWNKMAIHLGDTNVIYNGCAPQGELMQSILGATAATNSQGALAFTIPAGGQVTIALAAVTDRNNTNYFAAAQQQSQQATALSLTSLKQQHDLWWSNFWTKSYVQIPDQRIQNFWYASLYLMACCSTSNAPAAGIWGNFITSATAAYQGDYTLDYNYESPFFGVLTCNHAELADNYEKPLLEQMSRGTAAAQDNFGPGNTGIYFPVHLIASPGYSDDPFVFEGIKANSIFAAVNCAQRWKYTQDTNYAAKVYPYLKGVANFWNQYLVLSGGYYVDYNDASYEFAGNDTNPTMTLSFINLVYPALIQMSQALNVDAGSRAQWNSIVANLSPLPIVPASSISSLNALGAPYNNPGVNVLRLAASGSDFYNPQVKVYQDHQLRSSGVGQGSMLAIFPGWNIGLESPSYSLLAASNTVWLTAAWYDENANNFSYPSAACIGFDPNQILTNLDTFLSLYSYNNFMVNVNGGGIEEFATVPGTLASMFLQSYQTNVHIFPDWPSNQSAAFGNLNACGGFLVSGAITLGSANYVQVQSTAGQMLKLANPWPGAAVQCVSSLTGISTLSGPVLNYQTQVGEVLTLTSTTVTNLPAPTNLVASLSGGSAALAWNAVPGAGGYNVKRSTSIGGPYLNVASGLTGTNYTDASLTGHTTYYYAVTALAPGFESTNSAVVTVTPPVIANWSFEAQSVATNSYSITTPTSWSVAGPSGGAIIALIHPGTSDGRFGAGNVPAGMDGVNYCQVFMNGAIGAATVYQDLGAANQYQAGTTYTLTAAFGLERGNSPAGTLVLYNSALTPVATKTITPAMLVTNAFTSYSVTYTATGGEGGNGDIVVGFTAAGAAGTSFDVDNVRLTQVAPASTNATLTSLTLNPALSFTPAFGSGTLSYTATVAYGSSPTVTVAAANGNATNQLSYNGATNVLAAGVASAPLTLNPNPAVTNVIQVQVTAQDGVTRQTYTVNVVQQPSQTKPVLTSGVSNGTLTLGWPLDHLGYRLLTQTNNLSLGVSANLNDWATVPGATTTNLINLPITTTNLNSFYRLVYP